MMLIYALLAASVANAVSAVSLADKWSIAEPDYNWDSAANLITLDYDVSTMMTDDNDNVVVFDSECGAGGIIVPFGVLYDVSGLGMEVAGADGANFAVDGKTSNVALTLDLEELAAGPLYTPDPAGGPSASIVMCIRYGLYSTGNTPLEVNFLENVITLNIDLSAGFTVDAFDVAPKDKIEATATQTYEVDAKRCIGTGATAAEKLADDPKAVYNQGDLITVCVFPGSEADGDGLIMESILDFTWYRDLVDGSKLEQPAIVSSVKESDIGLTDFDGCEAEVCIFSTILAAQYYINQGQVDGSGTATLQFPAQARGRLLGGEDSSRRLQEAAPPTLSEFDLAVSANAVNDGPGALATGSGSASLGLTVTIMGLIASLFV